MCLPTSLFAIFSWSGGELLIVLFIILLLFGGSKLPSLARGLGQSVKEFKKAAREDDEEKPAPAEPAKSAEAKKTGNDAPTHGAN
jgi:sec-independent protein translocase protein TatA